MDDTKLKREMRRRKILENSEKRLQRITRCKLEEGNLDENTSFRLLYSDDKNVTIGKPDVTDCSGDGGERLLDSINSSFCEYTRANRENTSPEFAAYKPEDGRLKIWKKLGFKLIILATVVRLIHSFKLGYLFGQTIVIPFALFMMTQLGSCQFDQSVVGIAGPVLFFMGVSPNKIKDFLVCYNVVATILVYFAIYFSTFIFVHLVCAIVFKF